MIEKLRQLRDEYAQEGEGDPQFFAQLDDLENHLIRKTNEPINPQEIPANETHVYNDVPPYMPPPMLGPGTYPPPPMLGPGAYPAPFMPPTLAGSLPTFPMPPLQ